MYMGVQFNWGKKVFTFYRHPADDNKSGRATKNTMGRWLISYKYHPYGQIYFIKLKFLYESFEIGKRQLIYKIFNWGKWFLGKIHVLQINLLLYLLKLLLFLLFYNVFFSNFDYSLFYLYILSKVNFLIKTLKF